MEEEKEIESSLKYLMIIRDIRDNNIKLYDKIKNLPPKARTCKKIKLQDDHLISFFRKGKLKKFILNKKINLKIPLFIYIYFISYLFLFSLFPFNALNMQFPFCNL